MYELMTYSLKAGVCLAVFYLFFKLLLSRETFHRFNRIVVLGAMVLSFVLPLCVITVYREMPVTPEFADLVPAADAVVAPVTGPEPFPWEELAGAAFLLGAVATLLWTLRSLFGVVRRIRSGRRERLDDGAVLVHTQRAVTPFSWGRYIVISDKDLADSGEAILLHERAHLRLRHSLDLIVTDLAGCLQWFNPAMWLLRRDLRAIHEYEADEAVLESGIDAKGYQLLLIKKAAGGRWYSVANSFNHSKLKNRITMMLCKKSSRWACARALLLLPLTGLALGAFARTAYVFPEDKGKKENVTIRIEGRDFSSDAAKPLMLVDGVEVGTLDSLRPDRIESVTVLKDSTSCVVYGERGRNGVILVTMKRAVGPVSDTVGIEGLNGRLVKITADDHDKVRVIGYGAVPREGTVSLTMNDSAGTVSFTRSRQNGARFYPRATGKTVYVVDGVEVPEIESLDPDQIQTLSVLKGFNMPREYADQGYDGLISIRTKRMAALAKAAAEEAAAAGIEASRAALNSARRYLDSGEREKAQRALDEAAKRLDEARKNKTELLDGAQKIADNQLKMARRQLEVARRQGFFDRALPGGQEAEVRNPEPGIFGDNSVAVYKGKVTLKGGLPDKMLVFINGQPATGEDVARLKEGQIKRMTVYTGDEAVKRYGEEGRNGVAEIRARK